MRITADIHGKVDQFIEIVESTDDHVIQIGDFGFEQAYVKANWYNINKNKFNAFGGNHECYSKINDYNFFLGDYGLRNIKDFEFFFIRGGYSIDKDYRVKYDKELHKKLIEEKLYNLIDKDGHYSWFPQEELTDDQFEECITQYKKCKPDIVLAHECPTSVSKLIGNPNILLSFNLSVDFSSKTAQNLQRMFEIHQPKLFIFGHYHKNFDRIVNGTRFICRKELGYIDVDVNGDII